MLSLFSYIIASATISDQEVFSIKWRGLGWRLKTLMGTLPDKTRQNETYHATAARKKTQSDEFLFYRVDLHEYELY